MSTARNSTSAVEDVSLNDDELPVERVFPDDTDAIDEHPRWLWVRVGDGGIVGQAVWVRYFADEAPQGLVTLPADAPSAESPATIVTASGESPQDADHEGTGKRAAKKSRNVAANDGSAAILDGLATWIRGVVRAEIGKPDPSEWLDQHDSPLGKRRHLELVRAGVLKGRKDGKRVFVRRGEIDAYLDQMTARPARRATPNDDIDAELLGLGFAVRHDPA